MRSLLQLSIGLFLSVPALAQADSVPTDAIALPEPGMLALIGAGAVAVLIARRRKK